MELLPLMQTVANGVKEHMHFDDEGDGTKHEIDRAQMAMSILYQLLGDEDAMKIEESPTGMALMHSFLVECGFSMKTAQQLVSHGFVWCIY